MKKSLFQWSFLFVALAGYAAHADTCADKALKAAEDEYGNDPDRTHVKVLEEGKKYRVAVGIGNPEDGEHDYYVTFANGCASEAKVSDVPWNPHPLRDATQRVYNAIFANDNNNLPERYKINEEDLPRAALKQFDTWHADCATTGAYKIPVQGQTTYAVTTCGEIRGNIVAGIGQYILIFDSKGKEIDEATAYLGEDGKPDRQVGTNGISWQNVTYEQED